MGEEVTLAGQLRRLAERLAIREPGAAGELKAMAKEWERLEPVREKVTPVLLAVRALVDQPGWASETLFVGQGSAAPMGRAKATLTQAQEALDLAVEEALERWRTCQLCNVDRHVCPGCGTNIPHGTVACRGCSGDWHASTWASVKTGDRVRIGQAEATVEVALPLEWVGSGASQVQVKLEGRPQPYTMPPTGPVDIWREPAPVAPEWAADALAVLERAGLGPEVISHG